MGCSFVYRGFALAAWRTFLCVAYQNKVAFKMGGSTMHSCGDISVGGDYSSRKLEHADIDILFHAKSALAMDLDGRGLYDSG